MNKVKTYSLLLLPVLAVSAFSSVAAVPETITVDGGNINFTGSVVNAPCAVDVDHSGKSVMLGQVATNKLVSKGDTSSVVPFTIKLTGCDLAAEVAEGEEVVNYTKASITFNGSTIGDDSTLALNTSGSGENLAKNVGIQILQNSKPIKIDGSTATGAASLISGNNEIPFGATYVATADGAVAGTANSTVSFRVTYE